MPYFPKDMKYPTARSEANGSAPMKMFTQEDPRTYKDNIVNCDTVIFESISVYDECSNLDIMWGDCGSGAFLISRGSLTKRDFPGWHTITIAIEVQKKH